MCATHRRRHRRAAARPRRPPRPRQRLRARGHTRRDVELGRHGQALGRRRRDGRAAPHARGARRLGQRRRALSGRLARVHRRQRPRGAGLGLRDGRAPRDLGGCARALRVAVRVRAGCAPPRHGVVGPHGAPLEPPPDGERDDGAARTLARGPRAKSAVLRVLARRPSRRDRLGRPVREGVGQRLGRARARRARPHRRRHLVRLLRRTAAPPPQRKSRVLRLRAPHLERRPDGDALARRRDDGNLDARAHAPQAHEHGEEQRLLGRRRRPARPDCGR
mmetsp:Transcript_17035/g.68671  ORF Transcript_17035/g.68671 Transcript_17035/m.68671 type:complete len:277 (-) Transcript_17035:169-999(-)